MSDYTEAIIYSFFARNNDKLIKRVPKAVKNKFPHKPERCIAISREGVNSIMNVKYKGARIDNPIFVYNVERTDSEFLSNLVQVTIVACIHDEDSTLLLRLVNDTPIVSYRKGSLTYVQGHCTFTKSFADKTLDGSQFTVKDIIDKAKEDIFREIQEETTIESDMLRANYFHNVLRAINSCNMSSIYPIFIDSPGSMEVHLCILFDLDLSWSDFKDYKKFIVSNEPEKHEVVISDYSSLLEVDRADQICPWVAKSFSMLPFYSSTFIEPYLQAYEKSEGNVKGAW